MKSSNAGDFVRYQGPISERPGSGQESRVFLAGYTPPKNKTGTVDPARSVGGGR